MSKLDHKCARCLFVCFSTVVLTKNYNPFLVYCRELAPGTVSLTGDRAQGDDSKHDSHFTVRDILFTIAK